MPQPAPTTYEAESTEDLRCPACGSLIEYTEHPGLVSYWGDDRPAQIECGECGAEWEAAEHVSRSWTVTLTTLPAPTL